MTSQTFDLVSEAAVPTPRECGARTCRMDGAKVCACEPAAQDSVATCEKRPTWRHRAKSAPPPLPQTLVVPPTCSQHVWRPPCQRPASYHVVGHWAPHTGQCRAAGVELKPDGLAGRRRVTQALYSQYL